jgi:hypothetical protein
VKRVPGLQYSNLLSWIWKWLSFDFLVKNKQNRIDCGWIISQSGKMKKTSTLAFLLLLAAIAIYCKDRTQAAGSLEKIIRFKTFIYIDQKGTGIEAFRMLMPSDWQFEGGIKWILDNPSMPAIASFQVRNPKGMEEFEVFPNQPFFWTNNSMLLSMFPAGSRYFGNEVRSAVDALTALKNIVLPRFRRNFINLKIISEQKLPELARALGAGKQSQPGIISSADSAKIRIEYSRSGATIEEEMYGVVETISFPIQTMYGIATNTIWFVDYLFSFKAEKGKLDSQAKLFQTIAFSFRLNPLWFSKYNQVIELLAKMQIQRIQSIGQLSRIISQTSNEISQMMMDSYTNRQKVNDGIAENFSQYIRGVESYYNPIEGKSVELPSGYQNVWTNSLGEYILSDNPNFNPNVGSNLNWQNMKKK